MCNCKTACASIPAPDDGNQIYYNQSPGALVTRHFRAMGAAIVTLQAVIDAMHAVDSFGPNDLRAHSAQHLAETAVLMGHEALQDAALCLPHLCTVLGVDAAELLTYRAQVETAEIAAAEALRLLADAEASLNALNDTEGRTNYCRIGWVRADLITPLRQLMARLRANPKTGTEASHV